MKARGPKNKRLLWLAFMLPLLHLGGNLFFWSLPGEPWVFQGAFNLVFIVVFVVLGIYAAGEQLKDKTK